MIQTLEIYSSALKHSEPLQSHHDVIAKDGENGVLLHISQLEESLCHYSALPVPVTSDASACHAYANLNNCRNQFYEMSSTSRNHDLYSQEALNQNKACDIPIICVPRSFNKSLVYDNLEIVSDCELSIVESEDSDEQTFVSANSFVWNDKPFELGTIHPIKQASPRCRRKGKSSCPSSLCDNDLAHQIEAMVVEAEIAFECRHVKKLKVREQEIPTKIVPLEVVTDRTNSATKKSLSFSTIFVTSQASTDVPGVEIMSDLDITFDSSESVSSDCSTSTRTTLATSVSSEDFGDQIPTKMERVKPIAQSKTHLPSKHISTMAVESRASALACSIPVLLYLVILFLKGINPITVCVCFISLEMPRQRASRRKQLV